MLWPSNEAIDDNPYYLVLALVLIDVMNNPKIFVSVYF